ncbi:hypothetical protein TWF718_009313 [Orbilia javanica]|uniref:Uncharacterized protein n=1 Tax=Orbilia javanica TaxID=47235 RepID=A0AAN8MZI9_9PEZI
MMAVTPEADCRLEEVMRVEDDDDDDGGGSRAILTDFSQVDESVTFSHCVRVLTTITTAVHSNSGGFQISNTDYPSRKPNQDYLESKMSVRLKPRPKHIRHITNSLDPASLIGKHVIGFLDDYPLYLTLSESAEKPLEIHFGGEYGGGKDFEYFMDDHLRSALEKAAGGGARHPVKIIDAHVGEVSKKYEVPKNQKLPQHNGKIWHDKLTCVGLRLEGMKEIGYIWGEDVEKAWDEFCLYCGTFIATEEQLEELELKHVKKEEERKLHLKLLEEMQQAKDKWAPYKK